MTIWRMPVSLTGTVPGGPFINVWHFRLSSTPVADGSIGKVISELRAFYTGLIFSVPNIGPTLGPGLSITAEFATNTETQEQIPVTWAPMPTGSAGTVAPTRLALAVSWKTTIAARRARGRTFIGPLNRAVIGDDSLPKPQTIDQVRNTATALVNSSLEDDLSAVGVWGLEAAGGGPQSPHVLRDFTGASVKQHFATLRTRG
jgi:hypothetical protein